MQNRPPHQFHLDIGSSKYHLKAINFQKQLKPFSKSRSKSKTPNRLNGKLDFQSTPQKRIPKGVMQKTIKERFQYYAKFQKQKYVKRLFDSITLRQNEQSSPLREKPLINNKSQKLFKNLQKKRNLSPNVLQRFNDYQLQKKQKVVKMKIQSYIKQTGRKPRAQNLMKLQDPKHIKQLNQIIDQIIDRNYSPLK